MVIKIGVDVTEINDRLYDILPFIESCVTVWGGEGNILTSTSKGKRGGFGEKCNVLVVEIIRPDNVSLVYRKLKEIIGPNYNIVKDYGIIRIKWDPEQRGLF
ncbi:hypothetical protein ES703_112879 [subsurface metagenome]